MSIIRKTLIASALTLAFAAPAFADQADPWNLQNDRFFTVNTSGKMVSMKMSDKAMAMVKGAKKVPAGTVFFMKDGSLYMMQMGTNKYGDFTNLSL